jgi:hypothetical protein
MSPSNIFDQLIVIYGKPTPDTVCQNNLAFNTAYNLKDLLELLFKQCADCQEIAIIAKVPYTNEQKLMNVVNLLTHLGLYTRDMDNRDQKTNVNKT